MSAKWTDLLTPTGVTALWGAVLSTITAIWNIRRDYLQKRDTKSAAKETERKERLRARPVLVPDGGSASPEGHTFAFKNAGGPITKLRPLSDLIVSVSPTGHLGSGQKGQIRFRGKPPFPLVMPLEYLDGMGDRDVMTLELRDGHTFEVLGFASDTVR
jgi:hypothetical protein